jgi:hypothetical protein
VRTRLYYEMYNEVFGGAGGTDLIDRSLKNFLPLKSMGGGGTAAFPQSPSAAPSAQGGSQ